MVQAIVQPSEQIKSYTVSDGPDSEITLTPAWFGSCVWKGVKPAEAGRTAAETRDQDLIIDNVPGKIVLNQLASGTGQFTSFLFSRYIYHQTIN